VPATVDPTIRVIYISDNLNINVEKHSNINDRKTAVNSLKQLSGPQYIPISSGVEKWRRPVGLPLNFPRPAPLPMAINCPQSPPQ